MDRELEIIGAASAGGWMRWRKKHAIPPGTPCANCETVLEGLYCHNCGQLAETFERSIVHLLAEGFESFFHIDGRLWRTLPRLAIRPGRLTRHYLDGKRAYQIPPFRLFLVVLLIVFFVGGLNLGAGAINLQDKKHNGGAAMKMVGGSDTRSPMDQKEIDKQVDHAIAAGDAIVNAPPGTKSEGEIEAARITLETWRDMDMVSDPAKLAKMDGDIAKLHDAVPAPPKPESNKEQLTGLNAWLNDHGKRAMKNPQLYWMAVESWGHRAAFLMLPVGAFWLSLLYVFQRRFYIFDHLIFTMHSLAFQGLLLSAIFLLGAVSPWFWWLVLLAPVHLFVHMRGTYGSSVIGALIRMWVLFWGSAIGFGVLMLGLLVVGLTAMDR
jgi:hypothetical protein